MLETLAYLHIVRMSRQNWSSAFISHPWYTLYQVLQENLRGALKASQDPLNTIIKISNIPHRGY